MKRILLFLAALCLVLSGCAREPEPTQPLPTDPTEPQMKTVWVRTSRTTEAQGLTSRTELIYDNTDRVTEAAVSLNGTETTRYTVECDENGNFIRWTSLEETQEYTYDEAGRLLSFNTYADGRLTTGYTFAYNEAGQRSRVELRIDRLSVDQRTEYFYDEQGNCFRQEVCLGGELTRYSECVCDENGRIVTMTGYTADGTADLITEYVYDGSVETQTSRTPAGDTVQTILIIRDSWDNIIRTETYSGTGALLVTEITTWKAIALPIDCPRASI